MSKFKVGDKVVVIVDSSWGLIGTEGVVVEVALDQLKYRITGGNLNDIYVKIGKCWSMPCCQLKLISETKKKDQKQPSTTPLCYAEEQEKIQEDLADKVDVIQESLNPEEFKGEVFYSEGKIRIDGEFDITQAKALKKWLTKMTATPKKKVVKKVVKKVSKKKPSKKKDILKLSRK